MQANREFTQRFQTVVRKVTRHHPSPAHWYPAAVITAGRAQWGETVIGVLLSDLTDGLLSLK